MNMNLPYNIGNCVNLLTVLTVCIYTCIYKTIYIASLCKTVWRFI